MGLFNIKDAGQAGGEAVVAPSDDGASYKLAGEALTAFGGTAKSTYEGYVTAGMEGIGSNITDVGTLPEYGANAAGEQDGITDDELSKNLGFTKLKMAVDQGTMPKEVAVTEAMNRKNEAIAKAPWMREDINKKFTSWFGGAGGSSGGLFGKEEETVEEKNKKGLINLAFNLRDNGAINIPLEAGEQEIIELAQEHLLTVQQSNKIAAQAASNKQEALDNFSANSGRFLSDTMGKAIALSQKARGNPSLYQTTMATFRASEEARYRNMIGYSTMSKDTKAMADDTITTILSPLAELSSEDVVTGKVGSDALANSVKNTQNMIAKNALNNEQIRSVYIAKTYLGEQVTSILFSQGQNISLSDTQDAVKLVASGLAEGKYAFGSALMLNLKSEDPKDSRKVLGIAGTMENKDFVESFNSLPSREQRRAFSEAVDYVKNDLSPAVNKALGEYDPYVLGDFQFVANKAGEVELISLGKRDISSKDRAEVYKVLRRETPNVSGVVRVASASGNPVGDTVDMINTKFRLGTKAPTEDEPTILELGAKLGTNVMESLSKITKGE